MHLLSNLNTIVAICYKLPPFQRYLFSFFLQRLTKILQSSLEGAPASPEMIDISCQFLSLD